MFYLFLNLIVYSLFLSPSEEIVTVQAGPLFTSLSLDILTEQLQMHLQLLVQHTVLAAGSPSLLDNKETAAKRIVSSFYEFDFYTF